MAYNDDQKKKQLNDIVKLGVRNISDQTRSFVNALQNSDVGRQYGLTGGNAAESDADIRSKYPVTQAYDPDSNYMELMQKYADQGDYANAARAEQQRNSKITGEGKDVSLYTDLYSKYLPENRYVYDPTKNEAYTAAKAQQDALFEKIMNQGSYERNPDVEAAYQAYINQAPFSYNAEEDPLYQQYRDQYTTLGKTAMRDTMGQAAALTGGYGSTYAQQAGQQSYDAYLQRLNDVMPELYNAAYGRYRDERSDLAQRYAMAQNMDEAAYERFLNEQNREMNLYNLAAGQAQDAWNQDYNAWSTRLGLEREDEANAMNRSIANQQNAQSYLVSLISSTGYTPTDAELAAAGMTRGQANALKAAYEQALAAASFSSGGGGSSGGRSGGSGRGRSYSSNSNLALDTGTTKKEPTAAEIEAQRKKQITTNLDYMKRYGATKDEMVAEIERYIAEYGLDDAYAAELMRKYVNTTTAAKGNGGGKTGARGGGKTNVKGSY